MSSAGKSTKSASKFSVTDLTTVRSSKRKTPASPTASIPKATLKGKGVKKRKASEAEDLQGLPLIRHQFLEYFNDAEEILTIEAGGKGEAISVAHLKLTPTARERVLAFKKLDPETRSFQVATQDSQEVSSASATMSSAGKSAKSASKFGVEDLSNVKPSRRKNPASPSTSVPKAPVRGKGGKKRKASEDLQGFPLLRQQFLDYFSEKFAEIETYVGHVEDQDRQIADLQQMGVLKDLKIADLEKELWASKDEAAKMLINFDYEKHDFTQDAKVSAAITMYKIQLQMAA
ncbi:hypothetical protein Hdeb2414_s0027g00687931 [Helianthus debilis subsp. tardiflorus]